MFIYGYWKIAHSSFKLTDWNNGFLLPSHNGHCSHWTLSLPTDESKIATHKHKIEFDRTICTPFIISTGCSLEYTVMEMVVNCRQLVRSDIWQVFGEIVLKCYFDVASLLQHSIPSTTNLGYIYSQTTHLR